MKRRKFFEKKKNADNVTGRNLIPLPFVREGKRGEGEGGEERESLLGSECKYCAAWLPLAKDVPNLSHEKCLRVLALLHLRDYL